MARKKSIRILGIIQKTLWLFLTLVWSGTVLLVVFFALGRIIYKGAVLPNIWFGSENLGGVEINQLQERVAQSSERFFHKPLIIIVENKSFTRLPEELGVSIDLTKVVKQIAGYGRDEPFAKSFKQQLELFYKPFRASDGIKFDSSLIQKFANEIVRETSKQEQGAKFIVRGGKITIVPEKVGKGVSAIQIKGSIVRALRNLSQEPIKISVNRLEPKIKATDLSPLAFKVEEMINYPLKLEYSDIRFEPSREEIFNWLEPTARPNPLTLSKDVRVFVNPYKVANYLKTIAPKINQDAINAKLKIVNGKATVFQPSKRGIRLDINLNAGKIIKQLYRQVGGPIALSVKVTEPTVRDSRIDQLGIDTLIGKASTSFAGSPQNRVHNIENGSSFLNGILIKPGEVFSTVGALGAIDNTTGYLPELVIKGNRTIPEYGGGLCQVSTTLFRAALDAGLPIPERRNHSYRVSYYERKVGPGLDATIYLPRPDLKIKNDTKNWLLIQSSVKGKVVNFEIYGTSDGRTTKIEGPYTSNYTNPPPPEYEETDTLPEGEEKQIEKPHAGATSVAYYKVFNADGSLRFEQTFKSKYKALPARFLRGIAPKQE